MNKVIDECRDRSYFTITPRVVWGKCSNVYEYALWGVIKDIAGDDGECYVSTDNLATLSMMSTGKVSESRSSLLEKGLIRGEIKRVDSGQSVWHLTIPDLWVENSEFASTHRSVGDRVEYKKLQRGIHHAKPSPHEGKPSPHETKKIHEEDQGSFPSPTETGDKISSPKRVARALRSTLTSHEDIEEDIGRKRRKWETPDNKDQEDFLAVCKAKWFESRQKRKVKAILTAIKAGDVAGKDVYKTLADYLRDRDELMDVPPLLPRTWYEFRAEHARRNRWSRWGFISAILDRDQLMRHCQIYMKKAGVQPDDITTQSEPIPEPERELPEITPEYLADLEARTNTPLEVIKGEK